MLLPQENALSFISEIMEATPAGAIIRFRNSQNGAQYLRLENRAGLLDSRFVRGSADTRTALGSKDNYSLWEVIPVDQVRVHLRNNVTKTYLAVAKRSVLGSNTPNEWCLEKTRRSLSTSGPVESRSWGGA